MTSWRIVEGDALERLRELPAESVQCCITSPPYYGLRDYGTGEWEGGEDECDHLAPAHPQRDASGGVGGGRLHGTRGEQPSSARNGQQYRDACGKCGARRTDRQLGLEATPDEYVARLVEVFREVRRVLRADGTVWCNLGDGYAGKQLLGMPWRVAFALQQGGWFLRSDVIWAKLDPTRCPRA